jgi:DNA-binding response OmpR family regulator
MARVLIVDDEPNILLSLDYLLRKNKHEVLVARNGTEALDILLNADTEIVLLDIMMPDVDGYEICKRIKEDQKTNHIKVIFLSAKSKKTDIEKGLSLGADMYLLKPFSNKEIVERIKQLEDEIR